MTSRQKVWSEIKEGSDGLSYSVRYLLDDEEMNSLQNVGIVGAVYQLVGMQDAADLLVAGYEKQQHESNGGTIQ